MHHVVDDLEMTHFSIDVDRAPTSNKLNLIKRSLATTKRALTIFASSWAPPTWMTMTNSTLNTKLKGAPGEPYWKALALYFSKFITAYENEGIHIWGLTTQNEPDEPLIKLNAWQSLRFTTEIERDFIKKDLGPLLKATHPSVKIILMDDNKSHLGS
jgi:glucosylceramidase